METRLSDRIAINSYDGEGVKRMIESGTWFVGIKNYKPANDVDGFSFLEKHLLTEEVFVLLQGRCVLLVDVSLDGSGSDLQCVPMEQGKVYCVHQGVWHNTIVSRDVKIILIENQNTATENSPVANLSDEQLNKTRYELKTNYFAPEMP